MKRYLLGWYSMKVYFLDVPPKRKWWHNLLNVDPKPVREKEKKESWEWNEISICFPTEVECKAFLDEMFTIREGGVGSVVRQIMAGGYDKGVYGEMLVYDPLPGEQPYYPI